MQLRRWHQIGIVLAIVWALRAGYYARSTQLDEDSKFAQSMYQGCLDRGNTGCPEARDDYMRAAMAEPDWANIALHAFAPVVVGWLLAFIALRVYRPRASGSVESL